MITIDIKIKKRNPIKDFFHRLHSILEDMTFSVISKLPEKFIPSPLMNWLNKYLDKRINQLKQQTINMTWRNTYLQNSMSEIHNRQQDTKKAPADD